MILLKLFKLLLNMRHFLFARQRSKHCSSESAHESSKDSPKNSVWFHKLSWSENWHGRSGITELSPFKTWLSSYLIYQKYYLRIQFKPFSVVMIQSPVDPHPVDPNMNCKFSPRSFEHPCSGYLIISSPEPVRRPTI